MYTLTIDDLKRAIKALKTNSNKPIPVQIQIRGRDVKKMLVKSQILREAYRTFNVEIVRTELCPKRKIRIVLSDNHFEDIPY